MLRQAAGAEQAVLSEADAVFHRVEFLRLRSALADSAGRSRLPETAAPATRAALNDLRVRPGGARAA